MFQSSLSGETEVTINTKPYYLIFPKDTRSSTQFEKFYDFHEFHENSLSFKKFSKLYKIIQIFLLYNSESFKKFRKYLRMLKNALTSKFIEIYKIWKFSNSADGLAPLRARYVEQVILEKEKVN